MTLIPSTQSENQEIGRAAISPAGWPLRHFTVDGLVSLLTPAAPRLIEISKDFIRDGVSLKALARALPSIRGASEAELCFAGTTDLTGCGGFSWQRYRGYLAVQIAQARFLECSMFRFLLGKPSPAVEIASVIARVEDFCRDLAPLGACIEIHAEMESDPAVLRELMRSTPVAIVADLANMREMGLGIDQLLEIVPLERIAYVHQRNLPGVWIEHGATLDDESRWHELLPEGAFLWEPATIDDPKRIEVLFREYRTTH
ncbi:MAG TPA: hypothetical protein VMT00_15465 [Thermoanaerobaculia bacterium]|nr:hypothetical protein [Thermoanaerobaculia bacterium]